MARDEYDEEQDDRPQVLFQGAVNGQEANLKDNARLVKAGLVPAKQMVSDVLDRRAHRLIVEPRQGRAVIRLWVDGKPYPGGQLPAKRALAIIQMLKLLAGLDIQERKKPQFGGIKAEFDEIPYLIQVETEAGGGGLERLTLGFENQKIERRRPADVGFTEHLKNKIREYTAEKTGVILICGTPQSGRTTTAMITLHTVDAYLYSVFNMADNRGRELINVTEVEVQGEDGLSETVERLLRKECDVLFLDPISDAETAKMVFADQKRLAFIAEIDAADPAATVHKLLKWLEPELVAEGLRGVINQKLIRTLCPDCKEAFRPNPKLLARVGLPPETKVLYRERTPPDEDEDDLEPCETCDDLGYIGRAGMYELLEVKDSIRKLITDKAEPAEIRKAMRREDMQTLQADGLRLVAEGKTSLEELKRTFAPPKPRGRRPR